MSNPSQKNIVVVSGERFWHDYFPGWRVIYCRLQVTRWVLEDGRLFVAVDDALLVEVHAVLWRVGVVRSEPWHRAVLEMIRLAGVTCVNSAASLLRGFDKLSMHAEMIAAGLPQVAATIAVGPGAAGLIQPSLPSVLKVGNHHGGLGKARATTAEQWRDLIDMTSLVEDYAMIEPFIDYVADVRCLAVAEQVWCMQRESEDWKVNRGHAIPRLIEPPGQLARWTLAAAKHLGSTVVGLDFLQTRSGDWRLLECNDVPGLTGFPDQVRQSIADELTSRP